MDPIKLSDLSDTHKNKVKKMDSPFLTVKEAAEYLRCGKSKVNKLVKKGELKR